MSVLRPTIKLLLRGRSFSDLLNYAKNVHDGMDGNVLYPSPVVPLADMQAHNNALEEAITAWGTVHNRGSHIDHVALLAARQTVELDLVTQANYCESATPYDADAFITAGWELKSAPTPPEVLPAPQNLRQSFSMNVPLGSAKLVCNKVQGAKSYIFVRDPLAPETLPVEYASSKTRIVISGLTRGALYTFRVLALGAKGPGVLSDVCEVRVV